MPKAVFIDRLYLYTALDKKQAFFCNFLDRQALPEPKSIPGKSLKQLSLGE